ESADRPYRLLVEQMPQGAATLTTEGVVLSANGHFAGLLGRPLEALLGRPIQGFVRPADRAAFEALLRQGRAGSGRGEVPLRRADGAGGREEGPAASAGSLDPCAATPSSGGGPEVLLAPVLAGATVQGLEVCLKCPDGRGSHLLLSAGPLRDAAGRVTGAV